MPSPAHESYRKSVLEWCRAHASAPGVAEELWLYQDAIVILWELDLSPAKRTLASCYAAQARGSAPRNPLIMLRSLLLSVLVGCFSINKWVQKLYSSAVLQVLCGLEEGDWPGVGTFYDYLHRLHDGPQRRGCEHTERPSKRERRRSREPRAKKMSRAELRRLKKARRKKDPVRADTTVAQGVTARLIAELEPRDGELNPNDLLERLSTILLQVAVLESARRGLLGDTRKLICSGDGSPLITGANGSGKRVCQHSRHEKCDCPRIYPDPDAAWGYDAYRDCYFFGHHFYEISVSTEGCDLPLALYLEPGNRTDHTSSLLCLDRLRKNIALLEGGFDIDVFIHDCGADSEAFFEYLHQRGIRAVIPLRGSAPAEHPQREGLELSKRGVPLCQAGAEMTSWGSGSGGERKLFVCPVKAGKLEGCPLAPKQQPDWLCQPQGKLSPVLSLSVSQNPRLCPPIARNSPTYAKLYQLRTGTERSNSVKKELFGLERSRHRRHSLWLCRLHLLAVLQHARAWVKEHDTGALLEHLLGPAKEQHAA